MESAPLPTAVLFAFMLACVGLSAGALAIAALRVRRPQRVGEVLHVARPGRAFRLRAVPVFLIAVVVAWQVADETTLLWSAAVLTLSLMVTLFSPHPADHVCGADGVQRGWTLRAFVEFEEWRLTGEHLRFRTGATWRAVELPPALHAQVRARLLELAPERESPFQ